jgi:hypothetical protein
MCLRGVKCKFPGFYENRSHFRKRCSIYIKSKGSPECPMNLYGKNNQKYRTIWRVSRKALPLPQLSYYQKERDAVKRQKSLRHYGVQELISFSSCLTVFVAKSGFFTRASSSALQTSQIPERASLLSGTVDRLRESRGIVQCSPRRPMRSQP